MDLIYLDNAATTMVHPDVAKTVYRGMIDEIGNPSSLHKLGLSAELQITKARENIAELLGVSSKNIIFTSGGTESNNMSIIGSAMGRRRYGKHIITTKIEHPSVLAPFEYLRNMGFSVTYLSVDDEGYIDLDELESSLTEDTILVSIMHVNNEIGTIQDIESISNVIKGYSRDIYFHVDAVQSFGKLKLYPKEQGIDILSFSGHKIHGPKGVGGIYIGDGILIHPLIHGGGQEGGLRSGTENLPGIMGLGEAVLKVKEHMDMNVNPMYNLKSTLVEGILNKIPEAVINGPKVLEGAPHILNVSFPGIRAEVMLHALEERGIYVSTGSACSSKRENVSHVLKAIGAKKAEIEGAIRFSLSYMNTEEEMRVVPQIVSQVLEELKPFVRR
ncbi:MAG TPA: cysteine desulfurase [Clostridiales bacterium]|nr:cysteine desulfurase [Clostridiales bacterium]